MRKYGMVILKYQSIDARISVLNIDTLISIFASQLADFLYPPPPLYPPPNTMVILGSPRIPRRGMRVARSGAQRSDALRKTRPPDLRISCIHRLSCTLRRWIQGIRKSGECEGTLILPSC